MNRYLSLFFFSIIAVFIGPSSVLGQAGFPEMPSVEIVPDRTGVPQIVNKQVLFEELRNVSERKVKIANVDRDYVLIDSSWIEDVSDWVKELKSVLGIPEDLAAPELVDNLARLIRVSASFNLALDEDIQADVPVGVIRMKHENEWAGIPGDGSDRRFPLFYTEQGFVVVHFMTETITPLRTHPNREFVTGAHY
jgi:hypothetical protein